MEMTITKLFEFEAAHQLPWHKGKCARLHGHSYRLEVTVYGPLNKNGVIMDFADLKHLVKMYVVDRLDHQYLNNIIDNPTGERIAEWIWRELMEVPDISPVRWTKIRLYETSTAYVEITR